MSWHVNVITKKSLVVIGYIFYVYVASYYLLMDSNIVSYDIKPRMAKARFYFSNICRPYVGLYKHEAVTVENTEIYYYFFYPIDTLLNTYKPTVYLHLTFFALPLFYLFFSKRCRNITCFDYFVIIGIEWYYLFIIRVWFECFAEPIPRGAALCALILLLVVLLQILFYMANLVRNASGSLWIASPLLLSILVGLCQMVIAVT